MDSPLSIGHFSEPSPVSSAQTAVARRGGSGPVAAAEAVEEPAEVEPDRSATEYSYAPTRAERTAAPKSRAVPVGGAAPAAAPERPEDETQQVDLQPRSPLPLTFSNRLVWLAIGILAGLAVGVALGLWVLGG